MRFVTAAVFTALMCTTSLADTDLVGPYFKWIQPDAAGCRILGARDFRGPILVGTSTKSVLAIGDKKSCPKEMTVGGRTLRVSRWDFFTAERLQFKAYNKRGAFRLVWREGRGKYKSIYKRSPEAVAN
jgi:hypothetical protein